MRRRPYPKVNRDYSRLPELVLCVRTDEGEVEVRRRILMDKPLAAGMTVTFRDTKVAIDHVEEIGGTYFATARA